MNAAIESRAVEIGSLIVRTADVLGGRPRVRGHRVAVHRIAAWWKLGSTVEEISAEHPTLGPAEIHAALAYYHLHRAETDGYLAEESKLTANSLSV